MSNPINLVVATNFDPKLIEGYAQLNSQYSEVRIIEVFGTLPLTLVGHGRSFFRLPKVNYDGLAEHIKIVHQNNMTFNYLLNGIVKSKNKTWKQEVLREITKLVNLGVDSITATDDEIISLINENFPEIKLSISLIKGIDNVQDASKYSKVADFITLNPHTINRDITKIREIAEKVDSEITLYANISCLDQCPWRDEHYQFTSESSRGDNKETLDPFMKKCVKRFLQEPTELLKSPFIRPEDLKKYCKAGVSRFKLSDRKLPTKTLLKIVGAYMSQTYNGDLFDIIFLERRPWQDETNIPIKKLFRIDNKKLDKIDFFKNITSLKGKELANFYKFATDQTTN